MDILSDKSVSNENRPGLIPDALHIVVSIGRWLTGIFRLTEEDLSAAGIYMGSKGVTRFTSIPAHDILSTCEPQFDASPSCDESLPSLPKFSSY
jgi:hypothetical protein